MIGIDTNVLLYANMPDPDSAKGSLAWQLYVRANLLLYDQRDRQIVVPFVVVSELLTQIPQDRHAKFIQTLEKRFVLYPFDRKAASIAADLYGKHKPKESKKAYERKVLKADVKIIASAKAAGALEFYTHDANCRKMAGHIMKSRDLPERGQDLFIKNDIEKGEYP